MQYNKEEYNTILQGLLSDDCDLRRESAEDLGYSGCGESALELVKYLADSDKGVRDAVSSALKRLSYQPVTYALVEYLRNQQIDIRNYASDILVCMQNKSVPALIKMLKDNDSDVRKFSADILGMIKTKDAIRDLVDSLDDEDPNVVVSTIEALGNLGFVEAVDSLIDHANKNPENIAMVLDALGKIGSDKVDEFIKSALNHDDAITVFSAIETIGKVGKAEHLALLFQHLNSREDFFSAPIFLAIVRIVNRNKISLTSLTDLLNLKTDIISAVFAEDEVVEEFSKNIINVEMTVNLPFLLIYLKFFKKEAKIHLINSLKKDYHQVYVEIIALLLKDSDSWIVFKACELVSFYGLDGLSDLLIELLNNGDDMLEIGAAKALGLIKSKHALPALQKLLNSLNDDDVRKEVDFAIKSINE